MLTLLLCVCAQSATVIIGPGGSLYVPPPPDPTSVTTYGAKGDLIALTSWQTTSNSTTVLAPGANFSAATDLNKIVEIDSAGIYRNPSNETFFAKITAVNSISNITVGTAASATATNLSGVYGSDSSPGFSNCIVAAGLNATINIPAGNYLLLPTGYTGYGTAGVVLQRGGLHFIGQGNVTLTGCGGWKNYGNTAAYRSSLFLFYSPLTNDLPVTFDNITFDGGITGMGQVGNIHNTGFPADPNTGLGWDGSHHAVAYYGYVPYSAILTQITFNNCNFVHWRGEMILETTGQPNPYLNATNCSFSDGDGQAINNFAHTMVGCKFSNLNQAEEFYRTYATNASWMIGCDFSAMNACAIALNGSRYDNPSYTVTNCTFTNLSAIIYTANACNFLLTGSSIYGDNTVVMYVGTGGYQAGPDNSINSNLVVSLNNINCTNGTVFGIVGTGAESSINVSALSNQVYGLTAYVAGYGAVTNLLVQGNTGSPNANYSTAGNQSFGDQSSFTAQYGLDIYNNYNLNPFTAQGRFSALGGAGSGNYVFSYKYGARCMINLDAGAANTFTLDTSIASQIPPGAIASVFNATSFGGSPADLPVYTNGMAGPIVVPAGATQLFYWNTNKLAWQTNSYP